MARKLKTYQTSLGFFEQAIAAPSMKAALEAWGADSNLFHQGAAKESADPDVIAATMKKPGVVLKRPIARGPPSVPPKSSAQTVGKLGDWLRRCESGVPAKNSRQPNLFPGFPGSTVLGPFRCSFDVGSRHIRPLSQSLISRGFVPRR
jgi:hypothetical protein